MVELRFHQRTMWEGWFPEEASGWWEEWMKQADQVLDDEELLDSVYEAQGRRWPKSRRRGRKQTPSEVTLRLAVLKHVRNWSFEETEREVRANVVYRQFTRIGAQKVPDAKTLGRLLQTLGPDVVQQIHQRLVAVAQEKKVARGQRLRVDTTVVERNIHYPTDSGLLGDGARVLTRTMKKITELTESGNEVAQPHAHDRASGDGDCTDQPQQGAASSGKVETGLPKVADHDSQGSQPSEALPEGDRQRCETR